MFYLRSTSKRYLVVAALVKINILSSAIITENLVIQNAHTQLINNILFYNTVYIGNWLIDCKLDGRLTDPCTATIVDPLCILVRLIR
jgi:hypothetical protein